ncbi:unnamed protein product [Amoebophrya sp. A25]|nr:unnamed protein product [Amoebophrya sp. A25]|eukprot:GSA25T00013616001.1
MQGGEPQWKEHIFAYCGRGRHKSKFLRLIQFVSSSRRLPSQQGKAKIMASSGECSSCTAKFCYYSGSYTFELRLGMCGGDGTRSLEGACEIKGIGFSIRGTAVGDGITPNQLDYSLFEEGSSSSASAGTVAPTAVAIFTVRVSRRNSSGYSGEWRKGAGGAGNPCSLVLERLPGRNFNIFERGDQVCSITGVRGRITRVFYHNVPDYFYEVEKAGNAGFIEMSENKLRFLPP